MAKRPQRPKFLWNNAYLEKLATELGDECIFLCLSPVSFRMLADMSKMLLWATRYEEGAVAELGKTAYRELNVPCLTDFYSLLDELNNKDWLQSQFDDLGSRMTELEDMDVIVNQTVNGGCGCGCDGDTTASTSTTTTIPPFGENDTGDMPAYDDTPIVIADSEKCRAANYLAFKVVSMIRGLGNMGAGAATVAGIVTIFLTIVAWLTPIPGDEILSTSALFYYAFIFANGLRTGSFALDVFNNLADVLEADMQAFVCALYDWDTAEDLGNTLTSIIDDKIDGIVPALGLEQEASDSLKTILDGLFGSQLVNWFVSNAGTIVPADFIPQYDCVCGATGDTCPTQNIVLAGLGNFPAGDLTGTTQGFASEFNSQTGYHEIIFELDANYCVTIENGAYTPNEAHEKCNNDGVMVASDGSCIRRFVARSGDAFGTAVTFDEQTLDCSCQDWSCLNPAGEIFDGNVLTITDIQGGCTNYVVNSFSMDGNRLTANLSVGYDPCWSDGFKITIDSVGQHVRGWLFDDVTLTGPKNAFLEDATLVAGGASRNLYASANSLWDSCLEGLGYVKCDNAVRYENANSIHLNITHSAEGATDEYTLEMTIRAINDLSL